MDIDEVRAGFRAQTFDRLVLNGFLNAIDVNICLPLVDDGIDLECV